MRHWTHAEEEALRILAPLGGPALALSFDRSRGSIKIKAHRLGISLGRKSCVTRLEPTSPAVLRKIRALTRASLCPACAKRTIGVRTTGLCGPCHFAALREVHEEVIAKVEAQRALWASRAMLHRRRQSLEQEAPL
jgi:hypothetical protein